MRQTGWAMIALGVAILAFAARPLPAFVLPADWADWWFRLVMGDPSNGMGFARVAQWLFIEVPIGTLGGLAFLAGGVMEVRK